MRTAAELGVPKTYLSYAAVAAPTLAVRAAVTSALELVSRAGPAAFTVFSEQRERLRTLVAQLLGAQAESIAFVSGTSRGLADLAFSLRWRAGEKIVLFSGEFPANVTPWQRAASLFQLDVEFISLERAVEEPEGVLTELEGVLSAGRVRLVAVSAVQFQTGLRMPLERMAELCRRYGAELAVDGIQGCGVVPIDVTALGVDYLVCGAHKWLTGIEGAGFVYARPDRARSLEPRTAGWLSFEEPIAFLLEGPGKLRYDRPVRRELSYLEGSSMSTVSLVALGAGLEPLLEAGIRAVFAQVTRYLDALDAGLRERGLTTLRARDPAYRSGILSLVPPAGLNAGAVVRALRQRGVIASTPEGFIRFAPHYLNPVEEVDSVLTALDEALAELRAQR